MEENKNNACLNCKYFRKFTVTYTDKALNYDGYCSKRQKYKKQDETCKGFTPRDK